jgi:malonate transporter and related proteins
MSAIVALKLLSVFAVIGVGWLAGRFKVVGPEGAGVLSQVAFGLFTPALLFRTTAGIAVARLPWATLTAYFAPTLAILLLGYAWQKARRSPVPAGGAVRGLSLTFSNSVQLGIPVVTALFGTPGLSVHIGIVSLQSLVLLTTGTVLAETDLGRGDGGRRRGGLHVVGEIVRRSLIHPVVLPILLGLAFNATGWTIPGPVDDVLATLGQAVVPVSLVLIGLTLHLYGVKGALGQAVSYSLGKLLVHPAIVLAVAWWGFGIRGLPLVIIVLAAALPIGSNVLLFAGRYDVLQGETTAAIVTSTVGFLLTGSLWLLLVTTLTAT